MVAGLLMVSALVLFFMRLSNQTTRVERLKRSGGTGTLDLAVDTYIYSTTGQQTKFTQTVRSASSSPRRLTQVQMFPRNREYFLTSATSTTEQYYCLAFYSDDTVEDVTSQATWSAVDNSTGQPVSGTFFSSQAGGFFTVTNAAPELVRLSVSLGSAAAQNDQTVAKVVTQ